MSTAFAALERTRASLSELIAAAAAEVEATEANAAQAAEQATELAYQRGLEAGQALGRDAMRAEVLAIIEAQAWQLQDAGLSPGRLRALQLVIRSA